jgi:anti-sigma regulatory factor (Ser/Thr protein kinase)
MRSPVPIPTGSLARPAAERFLVGWLARITEPHLNGHRPRMKSAYRSRYWRLWLWTFGIWTVLGLAQAGQYYFFPDPGDGPLSLTRALGLGFGLWYTWALLWLVAFPLARSFPLGSNHWRGPLALHTAAAIYFAAIKIVIDYPIIKLLYCPTPEKLTFPVFLQMACSGPFLRYILYYWAMIGVAHALDYYGKYREGELHAAELEAGLVRAQLQLLKSQLHPHFLFNTLNAISALVHTDVEAADRMLARLGELLRLALEDFGLQEAPLAREMEVVRSYLEIEQARLGSRLSINLDVAANTLDAWVPTFLLQPLVENSIRHGIAPRAGRGHIEVRAWRDRDVLHLEVRDDGPGFPPKLTSGGVGLANTRARLFHLYGEAQRLQTRNDPRGGCVVQVTLPFRDQVENLFDDGRTPDDSSADRR